LACQRFVQVRGNVSKTTTGERIASATRHHAHLSQKRDVDTALQTCSIPRVGKQISPRTNAPADVYDRVVRSNWQ
jgi:hypothetical protein